MSVYFVKRNQVDLVPKEYIEILDKACKRVNSGYDTQDILKEVGLSKQLWLYEQGKDKAVCVTHIAELPKVKIGVMAAGGGTRMGLVQEFLPYLEEFFKNNNCSEMELLGSPGWARVMSAYGFKQKYIATVRKL